MSNVFFVSNNSVSTPVIDSCGVEGVMRRHVIETLSRQGITVAIKPVPLSDLESSDEVFLSNSQFGVIPVRSCIDVNWTVGGVTRELMAMLADNAVPECRL